MMTSGRIQAVGTMSGTSLDGVDAAVIETDGIEVFEFGATEYHAYSTQDQALLRNVLGRWPSDRPDPDLDAARGVIQAAHIAVLADMPGALIGFHGQTLAHEPAGRGTHQLGDGQALADAVARPVVWDFRSADVRLGGQGAPLAPFYHFACARHIGATAPLVFLNLGGVGNVTWIDPSQAGPDEPGALLAFDTGPANAPLNDLMAARRGLGFDKDGALARQGEVSEEAVDQFLKDAYFTQSPPKSLDRNDFSGIGALVRNLSDADAAATLCAMTTRAVAQSMFHMPCLPSQVLVCGGGRHNPVMMQMLEGTLDCDVRPVEHVGLNGDMLEAQAFAYLAVRAARGLPTSSPSTTGAPSLVVGGIMSAPRSA